MWCAGGFHARSPRVSTRGFLGPCAPLPQTAPGGSRGTPGCMPSQVPCGVSVNRGIAGRHAAWTARAVFTPGVPGFPPGASWDRDQTDSLSDGPPFRRSASGNTPGRARTFNLRFRRPMLYPIELRVRDRKDTVKRPRHQDCRENRGVSREGRGSRPCPRRRRRPAVPHAARWCGCRRPATGAWRRSRASPARPGRCPEP